MKDNVISDELQERSLSVNMNEIVKEHNILLICLDTLRYDVAIEEQENKGTPILNKYGKWEKRHAPGNFTLPSHMAIFAGFFPTPAKPSSLFEKEYLFIAKRVGTDRLPNKNAFVFSEATFIQGLAQIGYETICIGGVAFFDKRTELGKLLPSFFKHSYWRNAFSCNVKESAKHQVDFAIKKLHEHKDNRVMMYMNISALHYPNNYFITGEKSDSKRTHAEALKYVDKELERLFIEAKEINPKTMVIALSDHGTCYGEDDYIKHCNNHEIVTTVPYKHFFL